MLHEPFDPSAHPGGDSSSKHGFDFHAGAPSYGTHEGQLCCPKCKSSQIEPRHRARRVAAVLGVLAGATNGAVRALQAAELLSAGTKVAVSVGLGATGGPIVGTVASTLAAALLEGAAGCALGVQFGEAVDRMILPNYRCLSCRHTFSTPVDSAS